MAEIGKVSNTLVKLLQLLKSEPTDDTTERKIVNALQDFMEITTRDFMKDGHGILKDENERKQSFTNLNMNVIKDAFWREQFVRLHLLLTMKDSAMDVPTNLDARRRITFFANSLFMKMPRAPQVHDMISFRKWREDKKFQSFGVHPTLLHAQGQDFSGEYHNDVHAEPMIAAT